MNKTLKMNKINKQVVSEFVINGLYNINMAKTDRELLNAVYYLQGGLQYSEKRCLKEVSK